MEFHFMSHYHHLSFSPFNCPREGGRKSCAAQGSSHTVSFVKHVTSFLFLSYSYFFLFPSSFFSLSFLLRFFLLSLLEKERKSSLLPMHCSHAMMELQTCNLQFMVPRKKSHVSPPLLKAHPLSVTSNTFHYMRALKDIERERKQ